MTITQYHAHDRAITREDLDAMRDASRFYAKILDDGMCMLVANETIIRHGTSVEIDRNIPCGWSVADYDKSPIDEVVVRPEYTAFVSLWHPTMETMAKYVFKVGDLLHLHWIRDNSSESLENAGVSLDECELHILRGDPAAGKRRKLIFRLSHELITRSSYEPGRMVRRRLVVKPCPVPAPAR